MTRVEYYDDPHAPGANRIIPSASAFILNERNEVLVVQRADNGLWTIPGGTQEIGETITHTAIRETFEETGLYIEIIGLVGIYSDPRRIIAFDNGEVRQEFSLCFHARPKGGKPTTSKETTAVRWVPKSEIDTLPMSPTIRRRITHGYTRTTQPFLD